MQMNTILASAVISEMQSSEIYLSVKARLFSLSANLNGVRVTEAFLDEIVDNEDKYIGIQLYADVKGLVANRPVGHMYNPRTGEFRTTPIGSFVKFEKEVTDTDTYLVGTVRIMKRNKAVCKAVTDLFADNKLKFSFEINCGAYTKESDGTIVIDADPANYFEGEAIVTLPACEDAVALALVAECLAKGDEDTMPNENEIIAEATAAEEEIVAEEVIASEEVTASEEVVAEEEVIAEEETASVYVREEHVEVEAVHAYDTETGEEVEERIVHETTVSFHAEEETAEQVEDTSLAECSTDEEEKEEEETAEKKKCAEEEIAELTQVIAELKNNLETIKKEVAEMKESKAAESNKVNPFMAEMTIPKKYSLLEREGTSHERSYRLLERE